LFGTKNDILPCWIEIECEEFFRNQCFPLVIRSWDLPDQPRFGGKSVSEKNIFAFRILQYLVFLSFKRVEINEYNY